MLPADAHLELGAHAAPQPQRQFHQLADSLLIEHLERVVRQNAGLDVERQEPPGVVAGEPERRLGEVVGPEREELRLPGDGVRGEGGAGQLDHRTDETRHRPPFGVEHLLRHPADNLGLTPELLDRRHEGHHHLDVHFLPA